MLILLVCLAITYGIAEILTFAHLSHAKEVKFSIGKRFCISFESSFYEDNCQWCESHHRRTMITCAATAFTG